MIGQHQGGPSVITRILTGQRQKAGVTTAKEVMAFETVNQLGGLRKGTTSQGLQVAPGSRKRQRNSVSTRE